MLLTSAVPGPSFRDRFWAGFGRKQSADGPKTGPKLLGPNARALLDRFLVRSHQVCVPNSSNIGLGRPVLNNQKLCLFGVAADGLGPGAVLNNQKYAVMVCLFGVAADGEVQSNKK